jgi:predicted lipid-binding transport protein (Tim44 family)
VKGERGSSMRMGSRGHQARAACAAPMSALLPTPRVSGSGMHMGGMVSTLFWGFFSFFFFIFFIFVGIQKWVTTDAPSL